MTATPAVSVIIPAYNRATTIRPAIESVLRQTWEDFELIVVDDASQDATMEAVRAISDPRLRLMENPRNLGAAGARNTGIRAAVGDWIAFQDSDDEWLPRKLEKQMARLQAPGATHVGAYCGLLTLGGLDDRDGDRLRLRYLPDPRIVPAEGEILEPLLGNSMVSTQTLVVRRDLILELGGFDEALPSLEDWDFAIRLAQRGSIGFVDEPLVQQRFSANSITRDTGRWLQSPIRVVEKNLDLLARHPAQLACQYYAIAGGHRAAGDFAAARSYLARARRTDPRNARIWIMSAYVAALGLLRGRKTSART